MTLIYWVLVAVVLYTTVAPLTNGVKWWVRGWDFPRVHIAVTAVITIIFGAVLGHSTAMLFASAAMVVCIIYQLIRIYPYTRFANTEFELVALPADSQISLLSSNVLMENEDYGRLQRLIDREDPDVLLLMETDSKWEEALSDQLKRYPTVIRHPLSNHYGMHFATRLKVHSAETIFLTDDNTPTLLADLQGPTGRFNFVGLHPRPPTPGVDSKARDEQIRKTARLADRAINPVVAMGDFNDVAWSRTSEKFKEYGEFRDPRVGRGMLPSFDARSWFIRFPIDQIYLTEGVELMSFDRLESIGSDHFPMKAVIGVKPTE